MNPLPFPSMPPIPSPSSLPPRARFVAAASIADACRRFPDLPPLALDLAGLSSAERQLAVAIHRVTLQRYLTLEHVLNRLVKQSFRKLEPGLQAALLTGAAQLLFLRLPDYAVVDESVSVAGTLAHPQARGMANAVLRKVADLAADLRQEDPWQPARDRLPLDGGSLVLPGPFLPHPANLVKHLPMATSHPEPLVSRWIGRFGAEQTMRLCLHDLQVPPTVVVVEENFDHSPTDDYLPHEREGFIVWKGDHAALVGFLEGDRRRRVQDPAAFAAGSAAEGLSPRTILDYCAGQGTKSRQLAFQFPRAHITATDISDPRRQRAADAAAGFDQITVLPPDEAKGKYYDLLLLDVPCSNTGVLARRPEARYRLGTPKTLHDLVMLQRRIIDETLPRVEKGGHVLYTTCSIDPEENENQAAYIVEKSGGRLVSEELVLPAGREASYHDGSYHALVAV